MSEPRDRQLAVLSGGRSVEPLIEELGAKYNLAFLYHPVAQRVAQSEDMSVANLQLLSGPDVQARAINEALRMTSRVWSALEDGTLQTVVRNVLTEQGLEAKALVDGLSNWLPNVVFGEATKTLMRTLVWRQLIEEFDISVCVTHEDVVADTKGMVQFFRDNGIPTLHVPHAIYFDQWRGGPGEDVHDSITAEWIAVAGPYQRAWYIERGADPKKTIMTGMPHWDKWKDPPKRRWARNALKIPRGEQVVVYASSWPQTTSLYGMHSLIPQVYAAYLEAAKDQSWRSLIKLHPSAGEPSHQEHAKQASQMGIPVMLTAQYLDLALAAADLVVAVGPSNILIEAALIGVPTVSVHGFQQDEAVLTCMPGELRETIVRGLTKLWRDKYRKLVPSFLKKYVYKADGHATRRVLKLVEKIAREPEPVEEPEQPEEAECLSS